MPLPDLNLDDRTFEDLFNEARRRIPAYTPEWTDHNDSDPGITLLQLAAYFQEMIIWRLNRVPQKNYQKFLELVGLELLPASPARADLTFALSQGATSADIPAGAQVAMGGGSGQPILFETDEPLTAVGLKLAAVQTFDGAQFKLQTDANAQMTPYAALSPMPQRNCALYLGFDGAFPAGSHRLTVYIGDPAIPSPVEGGAISNAVVSPPVQAYWEYWAGDAAQWLRLPITEDTTQAFTRSGAVLFAAPSDAQARKLGQLMKPSDSPLFWLRFRIDQVLGAGYETVPMAQGVLLNTVPAINAVTETDVLLGAANGRPNQSVRLPRYPVLQLAQGQVGIIAVDEGDGAGYIVWTEVGDFAGAGPNDRVYTLDHATGIVQFGDGVNGRIPRWLSGNGTNRDDADVVNIKATSFRWGGGVAANGGAGTITALRSAIPYVASVTNLKPSFGGADQESVADAKIRTPQVLRTASRAVTPDDFAFLAQETPGAQISRAKAFPLLNPNFRMSRSAVDGSPKVDVPVPGAVTVIVVPKSDGPMPMPTSGTLQLVAKWLDQHRLLTAELFVVPPRYRRVQIEVDLIVAPTADLGIVQAAALAVLKAYFHPLTGGSASVGWDFGGTIYFSETYRQILDIEGVSRIVTGSLKTYVDDELQPPATDVVLLPDELVCSLSHTIKANYA